MIYSDADYMTMEQAQLEDDNAYVTNHGSLLSARWPAFLMV